MQTMKSGTLVLTLLIVVYVTAAAQDDRFGNIAEQQRTSTVLGHRDVQYVLHAHPL